MEKRVDVELNFFYMHYNDAKKFAEWATKRNNDKDAHPSIYARHAIISTVFASEALINRVLNDFSRDKNFMEIFDKASTLEKWYMAPYLCGGKVNAPVPFDKGAEPFQSFKELIQIRNWLAHPQVEVFLGARSMPDSTISIGQSKEEYPWIEMLKGEYWKQTGIPKNPFEVGSEHAEAAMGILDAMIDSLKSKLSGLIYNGWLDEITVKDAEGLHHYKASVYTIWGGYSGIDT